MALEVIKITVITVVHNNVLEIEQTIKSFLAQSHVSKELIIVDGGSTDGTLEIVKNYAEFNKAIQYVSEKDDGIYDAMNKGYKLSNGQFFGFLNSGDRFHSNNVLQKIANHRDYAIISGGVNFKDGTGNIYRTWVPKSYSIWTKKIGWSVPHPGLYINKSHIWSGDLFSGKYLSASDYELICKLLKANGDWMFDKSIYVDMSYGGRTTGGWKSRLNNFVELFAVRLEQFGFFAALLGCFGNYLLKVNQLVRPRVQR